MLRDITIGQHFPGNSLVHRFDPRLKLVLTIPVSYTHLDVYKRQVDGTGLEPVTSCTSSRCSTS